MARRRKSELVGAALLLLAPVGAAAAARIPGRPGIVLGTAEPHDLDLAALVPAGAVVDHVWFVPAGTGRPQLAVASRLPHAGSWQLTLWNPEGRSGPRVRWVPHALIPRSPWPIADWFGRSAVRLADVTGDGHDDLLVSVGIAGSNHVSTVVAVYASSGSTVRRIYGGARWDDGKDPRAGSVRGREMTETAWGARNGRLWFDEPRGGTSVCCPAFRLRYELRWSGRGWRPVDARLVRQHY